jgi:peptidoglycan-associated lipoprotein
MSNNLAMTVIAGVAVIGSSACATKGFVRSNVDDVNEKVNTLSSSLEQTENRVEANETRIRDVDQAAGNALEAANKADTAATRAADLAKTVAGEIDALEKARQKLVFDVVLSEQENGFRFASAELPEAAKSVIDELVARLKAEPKNVFITIEGHTDSVGPTAVNERIGFERARSVEQYLYEAHQIPLHKMEVISYGEGQPVAPNTTRAGRAQNRRVEIKIVS